MVAGRASLGGVAMAAELTAMVGFEQFLLAVAGVLFAVGVLLLLILNRLEGRVASAKAKTAAAREAHRALRARLGA